MYILNFHHGYDATVSCLCHGDNMYMLPENHVDVIKESFTKKSCPCYRNPQGFYLRIVSNLNILRGKNTVGVEYE